MVVCSLAQAWAVTAYDWDTSELLLDADLELRTPRNYASIAHPVGLVASSTALRVLKDVGIAPRFVWLAGLSLLLIATVIAIYFVAKRLSGSKTWALSLTAFYVVSPNTHEILARQEENLLYHLPFVLTVHFLSKFIERPDKRRAFYASLVTLWFTTACHLQPTVSIVIGLGLWLVLFYPKASSGERKKLVGPVLITAAMPCVFLTLLSVSGFIDNVPYHERWYSIFSATDLWHYTQVCFDSFQYFVFTKQGGIANISEFDYYVLSSARTLSGVLLLVVTLVISFKRPRFPAYVFWGAAIFASLYEPHVPERWDVILLSMIFMLAAAPKEGWTGKAAIALVAFMFLHLPGHLVPAWTLWNEQSDTLELVETQMEGERVIYGTRNALREIVMQLPYGTECRQVRTIQDAPRGKLVIQKPAELERLQRFGKVVDQGTLKRTRVGTCQIVDFETSQ